MDILDIFYNHIILEALHGEVDCYIYYNILFETYFKETNQRLISNDKYKDLLVPTLTINNKKIFDELLIKYVNLCLKFYDDSNFDEEISKCTDKGISKEKLIMTLLWSNATFEDFKNPEQFLQKRIAFLENETTELSQKCGYSEILDGNIILEICKDKIYNETPYKIVIKLNNGEEEYKFPEVKFGIFNDTIYFYAIQNSHNESNNYTKRINRTLFKIGEGFDIQKDNYDIFEEGNLKDVSASFVVALNIALSYFHSIGIDKINVNSIIISRWNAKKIALEKKINKGKVTDEEKEEVLTKQDLIQKNLTEKFLRTFLRLAYHYQSIHITSYPTDIDSNLHLNIDGELSTDNKLLDEMSKLVQNNNNRKR